MTSLVALSDHRLRHDVEAAARYAAAEKSPATRRAYAADWRAFTAWCASHELSALPAQPSAVAAFLAAQAELGARPSTLARRVASIRYAHSSAGYESPTAVESVRAVMRGVRRIVGVAPIQKAPVTVDRLLAMLAHVPETTAGVRDRAILLLGFAGAFRRSELAALDVSDLEEVAGGLSVTVQASKTDQERAGAVVAVYRGERTCPVAAVATWRQAAGLEDGPLFRQIRKNGRVGGRLSAFSIGQIVKHYAELAGFDPALFGGHSLRAGFITSAAERGASVLRIMDVSRHKRVDTLRGYVRRADAFRDHAGAGLL